MTPDPTPSAETNLPSIDGVFCLQIKRYGALGIEEEAGRLHLHMTDEEEVRKWLDTTMRTLGPGDRAEMVITRGLQVPRQGRTLFEELAKPAPARRSGLDAPLPGDDHPTF